MTDPAPFSNKDWIRVARATGRRWLEAHLPQIIAYRDICRGEKHRNTFGGPCNGQRKRCEMIKDLMGTCAFLATVETGTFRGDTTEFLARCTEQPIFSVEVCAYLYHYARHRLRRFNHVHLGSAAITENPHLSQAENPVLSGCTLVSRLADPRGSGTYREFLRGVRDHH